MLLKFARIWRKHWLKRIKLLERRKSLSMLWLLRLRKSLKLLARSRKKLLLRKLNSQSNPSKFQKLKTMLLKIWKPLLQLSLQLKKRSPKSILKTLLRLKHSLRPQKLSNSVSLSLSSTSSVTPMTSGQTLNLRCWVIWRCLKNSRHTIFQLLRTIKRIVSRASTRKLRKKLVSKVTSLFLIWWLSLKLQLVFSSGLVRLIHASISSRMWSRRERRLKLWKLNSKLLTKI